MCSYFCNDTGVCSDMGGFGKYSGCDSERLDHACFVVCPGTWLWFFCSQNLLCDGRDFFTEVRDVISSHLCVSPIRVIILEAETRVYFGLYSRENWMWLFLCCQQSLSSKLWSWNAHTQDVYCTSRHYFVELVNDSLKIFRPKIQVLKFVTYSMDPMCKVWVWTKCPTIIVAHPNTVTLKNCPWICLRCIKVTSTLSIYN